jgi:hypothetical protein
MQKVEGSNPFSRLAEIPLPSRVSSFRGSAAFALVRLRSGRGSAQWPDDWPDGDFADWPPSTAPRFGIATGSVPEIDRPVPPLDCLGHASQGGHTGASPRGWKGPRTWSPGDRPFPSSQRWGKSPLLRAVDIVLNPHRNPYRDLFGRHDFFDLKADEPIRFTVVLRAEPRRLRRLRAVPRGSAR